jgi:cytochrome c-type biogenesis protein CcmH
MRRILLVLVLVCLQVANSSFAEQGETIRLELVDRYKDLIAELRCLVCQNQSLADSDAGLAVDLRREVLEMMEQGATDEEIMDFLVKRYGDFVLYRPPVKPTTIMLWVGPFLLLGFGLLFTLVMIRRRGQANQVSLSTEQQAQLKSLLEDSNKGDSA